ncbi:MAG: GNAT family N-acetyltransferase [Candidatus Binatia bacterium]
MSRLRLATAGDVDVLLAMMRDYYAFDGLDFDEAAARRALDGQLAAPERGEVWLAEADGAAIGYAVLCLGWSLEFHGRDAFVDEIFVAERARGTGLGRELLSRLEERSRALGVRALHLEVDHENHRAQSVYRAAGFVDHDRRLMTKRLG